jgi:hypothetical protein
MPSALLPQIAAKWSGTWAIPSPDRASALPATSLYHADRRREDRLAIKTVKLKFADFSQSSLGVEIYKADVALPHGARREYVSALRSDLHRRVPCRGRTQRGGRRRVGRRTSAKITDGIKIVQAFGNLRPEFGFPMFSRDPKHLDPIGNDRRPAIAILCLEGDHLTPKVMVGIASHRYDFDGAARTWQLRIANVAG